jgi:hypothetical protein
MTLFWLMWVGLVLGSLIASLWYQESWRVRAFRRPARGTVRKVDGRLETRASLAEPFVPEWARGDFMPPPWVVTRSGPPPGRPAG